jgi:Flp pilus assembly protein TadB
VIPAVLGLAATLFFAATFMSPPSSDRRRPPARGAPKHSWLRLSPGTRASRAALPGLIEALAGALASGVSLPIAFAEIAPTLEPRLAAATKRVASSLTLGASPGAALAEYHAVVPAEDIAPLAVVLAAFARSGGRVTASLERIAALLRGRLALAEERAALVAQTQASALVLVALAPLGVLFFSLAMDGYAATLLDQGRVVLILALVFEIAGAVWLWRIVRSTFAPADLAAFLDAMIVGLEAGLTFERALSALVERASIATRDADARRLLADLALGRPLRDALAAFARDPDEARIVALVIASMRFGSPLARLLVVQADAIRTTERHRAEARARRLPVLMLFPLTFCILPALLLIFLGPPLLTLLA